MFNYLSPLTISGYDNLAGYMTAAMLNHKQPEAAYVRSFYQQLWAYYTSNGVYDFINSATIATRQYGQNTKPLRNPANRITEAYASNLWPGTLPDSLPIAADNERIIEPIEQIWRWSNFNNTKQEAARWFAVYGDLYIKVATKRRPNGEAGQVYLQLIPPQHVNDLQTDERGYVTYIRLDIPRVERLSGGRERLLTHTEVWDKEAQVSRVWLHTQGLDVELDRITADAQVTTFEQSHGEDFIPFVHQAFRATGVERPNFGCFTAQLDKIDEVNRKATRLAQLLFRHNKPDKALVSNNVDSSGRPLPPPSINDLLNDDDEVELGGEMFYRVPSGWAIQNLIAPLDYASHLAAIEADIIEIRRDQPELLWYELAGQELSGRALRYLLGPAISRFEEARGNGEAALARVHEMALTIGQNVGLFDRSLGNYEAGDFEHTFAPRPILAADPLETAQTLGALTTAGISLKAAVAVSDYTEAEKEELVKKDAAEKPAPPLPVMMPVMSDEERNYQEQLLKLGAVENL